jgi:hypothetical protein
VADRGLLEPAVAERSALRTVQEVGDRRYALPAAAAQLVDPPAEVGPPGQAAAFRVVEHSLQPTRGEVGGDVEQGSRRGGARYELAWLDVGRAEIEAAVHRGGHGPGTSTTRHGDVDHRVRVLDAIEPP